jgi:hypothetical protein
MLGSKYLAPPVLSALSTADSGGNLQILLQDGALPPLAAC